MAQHLVDGVDHRCKIGVAQQRRIAFHMPAEDADCRTRTKRLAHDNAFFGLRHEERSDPFVRQRLCNFRRAKPIGIGFHDGCGLTRVHRGQCPPVGANRTQINR